MLGQIPEVVKAEDEEDKDDVEILTQDPKKASQVVKDIP